MCTPWPASTTASSISGQSVMHTGQPGPMMTLSPLGKVARRPNLAMACSWLPQTCMTETGARSIAATRLASVPARARAVAGSRNLSSLTAGPASSGCIVCHFRRGPDLPADIRRHDVIGRFAQELLVERERLPHLLRRDAADGEAHMVQDIVSGLDRLVREVQQDRPAKSPEVHHRDEPVHFEHLPRHAKTHRVVPPPGTGTRAVARPCPPEGDARLIPRSAPVAVNRTGTRAVARPCPPEGDARLISRSAPVAVNRTGTRAVARPCPPRSGARFLSGLQSVDVSRAWATAAWPSAIPPSLGGTR